MKALRGQLFAGILGLLCTPCAFAHASSNSFLSLEAQAADRADAAHAAPPVLHFAGRWDIALRDLDAVLALDGDGDGVLRWGEIRADASSIIAYASQALRIAPAASKSGAAPAACLLRWSPALQVESHSDGHYAVLAFTADCAAAARQLDVRYTLFAESDAGHRGLLSVTSGGATQSAVAIPGGAPLRIDLGHPSSGAALLEYFRTGVGHIFGGYDHLLFLLSLLLPAVLVRLNGRWQGRRSVRDTLLDVSGVVTAFTVAHSLTLGLAVFGVLRVEARWSEAAIALSVLLAALNNLAPQVERRRWLVAFAFGLVHGLGFANVLSALSLPAGGRALALLGFNLGVEAGQLCVVLAFLPLAYLLRDTRFYRRAFMPAGSGLVAVIAALWLVERVLDQKWSWMP